MRMVRAAVAGASGYAGGEIVRLLLDRDFRALPVVDPEGKLVGILTNRDLVEREALDALDDQPEAAVGQLEHLVNVGRRAHSEEVGLAGLLDRGVALARTGLEEARDAVGTLRRDQPAHAALDRAFSAYGLDTTLREIIVPFLQELGERWARGSASIAQEHAIVAAAFACKAAKKSDPAAFKAKYKTFGRCVATLSKSSK